MIFRSTGPVWPPQPSSSKAIVTVLIGDQYQSVWNRLCAAGWMWYAQQHGYDLILVEDYLDPQRGTERSPAWQKLLILDQPWSAAYQRIVWMDSDIVVSPSARYDIADSVPEVTKVGISENHLSPADAHIALEVLYQTSIPPQDAERIQRSNIANLYKSEEIPYERVLLGEERGYSTGVMVFSPAHHRDICRHVYDHYPQRSRLYEQSYLGHELAQANLLSDFSSRYNWDVYSFISLQHPHFHRMPANRETALALLPFLRREFEKAYFLHFNGCMGLLNLLEPGDLPVPGG